MLNLKYYLLLMIGIFLSLGLGILMGISLESKDILENQQRLIAEEIEAKFVSMRNESDQLKSQIELLEQDRRSIESLTELLFTEVVENKLAGLRISLVETSEQFSYSHLMSLFKLSGASVESNFTLQTKAYSRAENLEMALSAFYHTDTPENLYRSIVEDLVYSIYHGTTTPLIERLKELNLIKSLTDIGDGCDVVVLAGRGRSPAGEDHGLNFDLEFIRVANEKGIPVIAVETTDIIDTAIPLYKQMGISTVDNVDTLYGKLALISLLQGSYGNYGIKDGSDALLPDPLFLPAFIHGIEEGEELEEGSGD